MFRSSVAAFGLALLAAGLGAGCDGSGQVLAVDLLTDYAPGQDFDRVEVTVRPGVSEPPMGTFMRPASASEGERSRVAEVSALPAGDWLVGAVLYRGDAVVGEGLVQLGFDGRAQVVTVLVTRDCAEVECPGSGAVLSTCLGGDCVDARCSPETPELCPEAECETSADCGEPLACVDATCLAGFCSEALDPSQCAPTESCSLARGCVPNCGGAAPTCESGTLRFCDPATGQEVEQACPAGCSTGGDGCRAMGVSNFADLGFDPAAPDVVVSEQVTFDTTACDDSLGPATVAPQAGGEDACVVRVGSFTLTEEGRITLEGTRPLAILAADTIDLQARVVLNGNGMEAGPGGAHGGDSDAPDGEGAEGGSGGASAGTFQDGGGGGGGFCGRGARGGAGASARGGAAGGRVDPGFTLEPLRGGSGGGMGPGLHPARDNHGFGGGGGGALQLSAARAISFSGDIWAYGGYGGPGNALGRDTLPEINRGAGGGGGAGGGVLFEAPEVMLDSGSRVAASGGGGGSGCGTVACGSSGSQGTAGPQSGGDEAMGEGASEGGSSGGDDTPDANPGMDLPTPGATSGEANGGGGGGGAGCVVIRTDAELTVPDGWSPHEGFGLTILPMHTSD